MVNKRLIFFSIILLIIIGITVMLLFEPDKKEKATKKIAKEVSENYWKLIGQGGGGRARVFIDPKNSDVIYLLISPGGIRRSANNGETLDMINNGIEYEKYYGYNADSAQVLAIHPENTNILLVSAEAKKLTKAPSRIYRSLDYGLKWENVFQLDIDKDYAVEAFAFHPKNPDVLYDGSHYNGVVKSTDREKTWIDINDLNNSKDLWELHFDQVEDVLYAGFKCAALSRLRE